MKTQKQHHFDKLRKTSTLFTQLGLVLALLIVYLILETNFERSLIIPKFSVPDKPLVYTSSPPIIEIERQKKVTEIPKIHEPKILDKFEKSEKNIIIFEKQTFRSEDSSPTITIDSLFTIESLLPEDPPVDFVILEEVPVFPGCEGLNNKESRLCFNKKIRQFVNKRFNTGLAHELGLSGKHRILSEFIIDKEGEIVNVKIRAPHPRLEKETLRLLQKLPKMTPGKQRLRPVKVKYVLPIVFEVQ